MHDIIKFLRGAVSRSPSPGLMGCYIVRHGSIYAYDGTIQAGLAMASDAEFNAPAGELEAALGRMASITSLTYDGADLIIKGGRLRATIHCAQQEPPELPTMPTAWLPFPVDLLSALRAALPFLGDMDWRAGIRLRSSRITALKNTAAIDVEVQGLQIDNEALLPQKAIEFLLEQEPPSEYAQTSSAMLFRWSDGRWLRTQLLNYKMPPVVDQIFEKAAVQNTSIIIDDDWRAAFADAAALSDGSVVLTPEGFKTARTSARAEIEFGTGLPQNHQSCWSSAELEKVMKIATSWNPTAFPEPCAFSGPHLRGVIVGIRK